VEPLTTRCFCHQRAARRRPGRAHRHGPGGQVQLQGVGRERGPAAAARPVRQVQRDAARAAAQDHIGHLQHLAAALLPPRTRPSRSVPVCLTLNIYHIPYTLHHIP
jgi:hypothetical protein